MITTEFNLERAKAGAKIVTNYGEPAEIIYWNAKGQYPLVILVDDGDTSDAFFCDNDGHDIFGLEAIRILEDE